MSRNVYNDWKNVSMTSGHFLNGENLILHKSLGETTLTSDLFVHVDLIVVLLLPRDELVDDEEKLRRQSLEVLVEVPLDGEGSEDVVVDQGRPQVGQDACKHTASLVADIEHSTDLTRLPPRDSTLDGRWTRKPSRVQPIYLPHPS